MRTRVAGDRDRAELRMARQAMRGLVQCPLCGRSGGAIRDGHEACERCRSELAPTPLDLWRRTMDVTVAELAAMAGVTSMSIHRALRGEPIGERMARALERVTGIDADELMEGCPSPFARRDV